MTLFRIARGTQSTPPRRSISKPVPTLTFSTPTATDNPSLPTFLPGQKLTLHSPHPYESRLPSGAELQILEANSTRLRLKVIPRSIS